MKTPKSFEDGMTRLETILTRMQSGEITLAESVKLYAEAAALLEYCNGVLNTTALQIEEIGARLISEPSAQSEEDDHGV